MKKLLEEINSVGLLLKNGFIRALRSFLLESRNLDVFRVYSRDSLEFMKNLWFKMAEYKCINFFFKFRPADLINRHEFIDCYCIIYGKDAPICLADEKEF